VTKLLVLSILIATFVVPAMMAAGGRPRRALRMTVLAVFLFEVAYALFLRFAYERIL
jgi:hypothetical protein